MTLILLGAAFFLIGLGHRLPALDQLDAALFRRTHQALWRVYPFFRLLWMLGTTPAALFLIFALFLHNAAFGIATALVYLAAALLERGIKMRVRRPRPFEKLSDVHMTQPRAPKDPSFPSGDALRVWFLAAVLAIGFHVSAAALWTLVLAATLVSLGRLALGVHYPLDVLAGSGLGLFFAGWLSLVLS